MEKRLFRTGKTDFTDDELILLDVMFDCYCPVNSLKQSKFEDFFNTKSHNLTDEELKDKLERLHEKKIVRFIENQDSLEKVSSRRFRKIKSTFVGLTINGGKLWEKEREPIWLKYCVNLCDCLDNNKRLITVTSPSLKTVKNYLKIAKELNLNEVTEISDISFKFEQRKYIEGLSWKRFNEVYTATINGWQSDEDSEQWHDVDWDYYSENLDWWDNVHELNILKQKNIS